MKIFLLLLPVTLVTSVVAATESASEGLMITLPAERIQALMIENASLQADLMSASKEIVATKKEAALAVAEDIKSNASFQKIIKQRDKDLAWYRNSKLVQGVLWLRRFVYGFLALYVIAWIAGFFNPLGSLGWMFRLSSELVKLLPFGNIIRWGNPSVTTIRASTIPVIQSDSQVQVDPQ